MSIPPLSSTTSITNWEQILYCLNTLSFMERWWNGVGNSTRMALKSLNLHTYILKNDLKMPKSLKSPHGAGVEPNSVSYFCPVLFSVSVHLLDHSGISGSGGCCQLPKTTLAHLCPHQPGWRDSS